MSQRDAIAAHTEDWDKIALSNPAESSAAADGTCAPNGDEHHNAVVMKSERSTNTIGSGTAVSVAGVRAVGPNDRHVANLRTNGLPALGQSTPNSYRAVFDEHERRHRWPGSVTDPFVN